MMNLFEATELFLSTKARKRPTTQRDYKRIFRDLREYFGDRRLETFLPQELLTYLNRRNWAARTWNHHRTVLKMFFQWAQTYELINRNPLQFISAEREPQEEIKTLSREDEAKLLEACKNPYMRSCCGTRYKRSQVSMWTARQKPPSYLYPAVLCALRTGLRRKNIENLCWKEIDFAQKIIRINAHRMKGHAEITIPMTADLQEALSSLQPPATTSNGRVFHGISSIGKTLAQACKRAGIEPVTLHTLRKTFLTRLAPHCDLKTLQSLAGHAHASTTMKFYIGTNAERKRQAILKAFAASFAPPSESFESA